MRILIIVILIDIFIFTLGIIFADKELKTSDTKESNFRMDRYGYYWKVQE
jgi:hypothetical protein